MLLNSYQIRVIQQYTLAVQLEQIPNLVLLCRQAIVSTEIHHASQSRTLLQYDIVKLIQRHLKGHVSI